MVKAIVFLLLGGLAQAALLMDQMNHSQVEEAEGDLAIKMPDAVTPEIKAIIPEIKAKEKPQISQSLVESQSTSQLGMFESGVLSASLKPIVKAKVKNVAIFIEKAKDAYEQGTEDQRKELKSKLESLIMLGAGTRGFVNDELCNLLWGLAEEWAGEMSSRYCPDVAYPNGAIEWKGELVGSDEYPPWVVVAKSEPSRLRSAFLCKYFSEDWIRGNVDEVISFLHPDVTYFDGVTQITGKNHVSQLFPYIGLPFNAKMLPPYRWHVDKTTCLAPLLAWAEHDNYVMFTFNAVGQVTDIIVPLSLWR